MQKFVQLFHLSPSATIRTCILFIEKPTNLFHTRWLVDARGWFQNHTHDGTNLYKNKLVAVIVTNAMRQVIPKRTRGTYRSKILIQKQQNELYFGQDALTKLHSPYWCEITTCNHWIHRSPFLGLQEHAPALPAPCSLSAHSSAGACYTSGRFVEVSWG